MSKSKDKPLRFEEAIEQIEAIISNIESGDVGLEDCIEQYENGLKHIARCREVLDKAQARIAELTADAQGGLRSDAATGDDEDSIGDTDSADEDDTY